MRIGLVSPRINGLSVAGIGNPPTPDLLGQAQMYLNAFTVGLTEPGAATPDVVAETLTQAAKDACAAAYPTPCDPNSISTQIASMVASYTAAYNAAQAGSSNSWPGNQSVQSPGYTPAPVVAPTAAPVVTSVPQQTAQVQYSSQPSNALDRVTPQSSIVTPTRLPVGTTVLSPPTTQAPVVPVNQGTFTGTTTVTAAPGTVPTTTDDSIISGIPDWALLGAAVLGLFLLVKK